MNLTVLETLKTGFVAVRPIEYWISMISGLSWSLCWYKPLARKMIHYLRDDGIGKFIPQDHLLSLLDKPHGAERWFSGTDDSIPPGVYFTGQVFALDSAVVTTQKASLRRNNQIKLAYFNIAKKNAPNSLTFIA